MRDPELGLFETHSHKSNEMIQKNCEKYPKNTAFVCASDRIAVGIERGIQKKGASIPDDSGIIGYDGFCLDQVVSPRLTTIRQDVAKLGEICGEMLLNKIEQKGKKQGFKLLDPMLVKRETTRRKGDVENVSVNNLKPLAKNLLCP